MCVGALTYVGWLQGRGGLLFGEVEGDGYRVM